MPTLLLKMSIDLSLLFIKLFIFIIFETSFLLFIVLWLWLHCYQMFCVLVDSMLLTLDDENNTITLY